MTTTLHPTHLGLIAGRGIYPRLLAESARAKGVTRLDLLAFTGETDPALAELATNVRWVAVGQLGKLLKFFEECQTPWAMMAGQIAPGHLFDLKPDLAALLLLAKLKRRNAETIFRAIAMELDKRGTRLLPAHTFLEHLLFPDGHLAGPPLRKRQWEDVGYGFEIAKECSRLDIGQSVVVKQGTVLAVEAFEGTDVCMQRGGALGGGGATLVKVSKPNQDVRFDLPVMGERTLRTAHEAGIRTLAGEAGATLFLDPGHLQGLAKELRISVVGVTPSVLQS